MGLPCGKLGEGDHPHAPDLLKVPLTQPAIAGPSFLPSPRKRGEGAITTAAVFLDAAGLPPQQPAKIPGAVVPAAALLAVGLSRVAVGEAGAADSRGDLGAVGNACGFQVRAPHRLGIGGQNENGEARRRNAANEPGVATPAHWPQGKRRISQGFKFLPMKPSIRSNVSPILVRSGEWPGLRSLSK
jgi:hypothetical protein